jgi:hypothetical protein
LIVNVTRKILSDSVLNYPRGNCGCGYGVDSREYQTKEIISPLLRLPVRKVEDTTMGGLSLTHVAIVGIILIAIIAGVVAVLGGRGKPPR